LFPQTKIRNSQTSIGDANAGDDVFFIGAESKKQSGKVLQENFDTICVENIIDNNGSKKSLDTVKWLGHYLISASSKVGDSGASVWKIVKKIKDNKVFINYVLIGILRGGSIKGTIVAKIDECFEIAKIPFDSLLFQD